MAHPSKVKGNNYERELVNDAKRFELKAKRCWGSDGRSMGLDEQVDLVVEDFYIQAKRRKSVAKWILPEAVVDAQCVRGNNGESFIIMRWEDWLAEMHDKKDLIKTLRRLSKENE